VTEVGLRWGQLGVLTLLWAWLAWRAAARRRAPRRARGRRGDASQSPARPGHSRLALVGALAVVGVYYLLELGVWAAYARAGQRAAGTGFLLDDLSFQTVLLPFFLTLVVLLGSTDLLEWGELTARWTVAQVRRVQPRWVLILTPLAALAVVANVLRLAPPCGPAGAGHRGHPGRAGQPARPLGARLRRLVGRSPVPRGVPGRRRHLPLHNDVL